MEPKKQAALMIFEFMPIVLDQKKAKECALIAVNLILEDGETVDGMRVEYNPYWLEVKQEIEKL